MKYDLDPPCKGCIVEPVCRDLCKKFINFYHKYFDAGYKYDIINLHRDYFRSSYLRGLRFDKYLGQRVNYDAKIKGEVIKIGTKPSM